MLVHDYDDEQTLDEEEAMSNDDSVGNELDDLQKESEIPVEELLAMYGYGKESFSKNYDATPSSIIGPSSDSLPSQSGPVENQDNFPKDCIADDLELQKPIENMENGEAEVCANNSSGVVEGPFNTTDFLCSDLVDGGSDDDEDYDPEQDQEDWKKTVPVGPEHQASVPEGPTGADDNILDQDKEDRILWSPLNLNEDDVATYLAEVHKHNQLKSQGLVNALPYGCLTRDDEQALYLLLQCDNNFKEALRRHKLQGVPPTDPMSLWTEEECRNFETGLRLYGKDFFLNQQNKVKSRSVREIVQFYYLWKKTERHDAFAARTRLEKKKYALHPGITDYMDRFIYEYENPLVEVATCNMNTIQSKEFTNVSSEFRSPGDLACHLSPSSMTSHGFQQPILLNPDHCSDGLLDCCSNPSQLFDNLGANSSSHSQLVSSSQHVQNSNPSHSPSFSTSACYDYSVASSAHVLPTCGISSYTFHPPHHQLQNDVHNSPCCAAQVDCISSPAAARVFGLSGCSASLPPTTTFYPVIDSIVPDVGFASKTSNECSLTMMDVDVEGLIVSSNLNAGEEPQELSITDINMIFDNVERPPACIMPSGINLNRRVGPAGDVEMVQPDSTYLPPSMQKLCSDDGIEPTLESISASIQELVDPENILSVLEAVPCSTVAVTTAASNSAVTCMPDGRIVSTTCDASNAPPNVFPFMLTSPQSGPSVCGGSVKYGGINDISSHSLNATDELSHPLPIEVQPSLLNKADFEPKGCPDTTVTS